MPVISSDDPEHRNLEPLSPPDSPTAATAGPARRVMRQLRRWFNWTWTLIASAVEWLFGLFSLVVGLSVVATIPLIQVLSLGYLLEACGRIGRTGRLRDGFVGIRKAARVGSVVLGTWLVLWPARAISGLWYSSLIINGHTRTTALWRLALIVVVVLTILHLLGAWFRGGQLRHFAWPAPRTLCRRLAHGGCYHDACQRFWQFVGSLRLGYYFQLGLRAAVAALAWLVGPVTLMVLAPRIPAPASLVAGLLGGAWLAVVLLYLPFLQARFAVSNQTWDLFDVRAVRACFARAPIAFWISLLATLALALPLYLLKAELVPREAAWLPSIVFVVFTLPARWISGWAIARSQRRETPRHAVFRWAARLSFVPLVAVYVLVVYFTQYVSWYGGLSLYEQHAFLLPVPFLGM